METMRERRERIEAIDSLIPDAEAYADKRLLGRVNRGGSKIHYSKAKKQPYEIREGIHGEYEYKLWTELFSKAMQDLTIGAGLRVEVG